MRIENIDVVTSGPARPAARGLVIEEGRIVRLLADAAGEPPADRAPAFLLPGFHDAHVHLTQAGLALGRVGLAAAVSLGDAMERLRAGLDAPRDEVALVGEGADESAWPERRLP